MSPTIDTGPVVAQTVPPIVPADTHYGLLRKCFETSDSTIARAIEIVGELDQKGLSLEAYAGVASTAQYYSYPKRRHETAFARMGRKFF